MNEALDCYHVVENFEMQFQIYDKKCKNKKYYYYHKKKNKFIKIIQKYK